MKPTTETARDTSVITNVCASDRRAVRKRAALLSSIVLILFITTSCASLSSPSVAELSPLAESANKYRPIKLASGVQDRPGGIAWSQDGKTLAFIGETVNLYDVESAELKKVRMEGPHFLSWSADDNLLVLAQEPERNALCSIDRKSLALTKSDIDSDADAIFTTTDPRNLLVLSKKVRQFSFGTEVVFRISERNDGGTEKTLYTLDRTYPGKQIDLSYLMAWTHAGPNPVDNTLLIIEHALPPGITPDSRVFGIDPLTGLNTDISDKTTDHVYISGSWSPDGRMVVLTNGNGYLIIHTILGREFALEPSIRGIYPSWSPWGHRIYAGGFLYDLSRNETDSLLTDGLWSIAEWSPDGKKLAVASSGELWLFSDILSAVVSSQEMPGHTLKGNMSQLQGLYRKGGITALEYEKQHNRLMLSVEDK